MTTNTELDLNQIWNSVIEAVRLDVSPNIYKMYLAPTEMIEWKEMGERWLATVGCSMGLVREQIEKRYLGQLTQELARVTQKKCEIKLIVKSREEKKSKDLGPLFEDPVKPSVDNGKWKRANLREDYTFETYAVGGSNQMAFAAAQAVAKRPGEAYNPLFIYGGVGVGKTHLMQAIGREVLERSDSSALFCSGEEFTNDLVEAIRYKTTDKVRAKYRRVKILMIDDVQFIAGKQSIQEDFFHTYNAVTGAGGQVIMTSDRPPSEIPKLEERLRSRFGSGLLVDVGQPDFELRTAILLIKSKQRGIELDMKVAQMIATSIEGVRELQGFLTKLLSESEVKNVAITPEWVSRVLNITEQATQNSRIITPGDMFNVVSNYYGVGVAQLKGERRTKTLAWARQVVMYMLHMDLKLSLEEVGRIVGGRDHSTVIHARDKVIAELEANLTFANEFASVKRKLMGTTSG